ncbi:hypothetical protein AOL_s00078g608 [Orbilia oligospora ATCC 24927]|uniref:Uncharacterized protein n=1 Tax=Arthrobotrys oligospora (strain ATCC 24927 / CBS 115.81 / DSM 1491) TaxID=756982 RepID=G1XCG1_ARTOA|nr:hypothetical protein AOL_s00078g608 [Orbilia oligospora ATCC 24927]EGX49224.1 hypothetical protein AOL_s00078g608 [Orbilia oligospora ATCC 24927]
MISFSDFTSALQKITAHEYGWKYIVAVATVIATVLISCNWTYLNTGYRGPGCPQIYKPRAESPTRGRDCIHLHWTFPNDGTLDFREKFYFDGNDPDSLRKELGRYGMAGIIVLPTLHGYILGHGKLLLVDDGITTRDLIWPSSARTFFLAVYPEDAFQAMISVGSPLLETLANPGPTWANPKDIRDFEEMVWTMRQSFGKSRGRSKAT